MYLASFLIISTAALLSYVSSVLVYAAFGLVIAAVLIILTHQPLGRIAALTAILLILSFVIPAISVHETPNTADCAGASTPCDPSMNSHPGLRLGLAAALLIAALITASVGLFRSFSFYRRARCSAP